MSDYIVREFQERRVKQDPIPSHLEKYLNHLQMTTLLFLKALGWKLWFVRRALFQPVMPVLWDPSGKFTAIIEENGKYDVDHGIAFRA